MKNKVLYVLVLITINMHAQIGGKAVFEFLKFPIAAKNEALGGGVLSIKNEDISIAISNPCLIDSTLHKQLSFSNSFYIDGINNGNISYAHQHKKIKTTLLYTMQYNSYGNFDARDIAGNSLGNFRAADFNLQVGTAHHWKNFFYGMNLKFIYSHLAQYQSLALATDVTLAYHNTTTKWSFSVLLRNAGFQLKPYLKEQGREQLPLQLDATFSKRFKHLPLTIIGTAHNLQVWNLSFPQEATTTIFGTTQKQKNNVIDNIFRHVIIGAEIEAGKPVRIRLGYNHLRRKELASSTKKGFAGLNFGMGLNIKQFGLDYAFGAYHAAGNNNYLTFRVHLNQFGNKAK